MNITGDIALNAWCYTYELDSSCLILCHVSVSDLPGLEAVSGDGTSPIVFGATPLQNQGFFKHLGGTERTVRGGGRTCEERRRIKVRHWRGPASYFLLHRLL